MSEDLKNIASQVRRDIVRMVHGCQSWHPCGSLGCTDFLVALYFKVMKPKPNFGAGLLEAGKRKKNIVALCADLIGSLKMHDFIKAFPERFTQVGMEVLVLQKVQEFVYNFMHQPKKFAVFKKVLV